MSVFATLNEFKAHLGFSVSPLGLYNQLTDRLASQTADDAVGQELVDAAEGEVRDWLGRRYALPTTTPSDAVLARSLKTFVLDIAAYRGFEGHPNKPKIPQKYERSYQRTIDRLTAIADGKAALPGAESIPGPTTSGPTSVVFGHQSILTEEGMKGF